MIRSLVPPVSTATRSPMSPFAAWTTSLAATAASTYALDVWAAAAGAGLVASGLLADLGHRWVVAFLIASYTVWVFGLRANLKANGSLLAATGTSTNVLSKLAYDITRRRWGDGRAARLAAAVAYTGTEVAKEVPYYTAAFGAAVVTDAITTDEALVFLAGANLGAAFYEAALARLTRTFLDRRRGHASFDTDWVPAEYLTDYYRTVEPDELATIAFLVDAMQHAERDRPILYFGTGPTLHHVFACAETASEIHLGDYLPENLAEIQRWIDRAPGAHDWRPFVRYTLQCEGNPRPTDDEVTAREDLTRAKITTLVRVDARHPHPVNRRYATVISAYCADSATSDRTTWELFMRHITGLVQPGGLFLTAALRRCRGYTVGGKTFPGADIDERDLRAALQPDFELPHEGIEVIPTAQNDSHGYAAILLGRARRAQLVR
ncbi:NNMT/PNMT/TEMT family class I SAM-dependent methyltransferase [Actinoplanes sp. NBC_00393]|uniref:guanitoxin biosynthesis pre-guanitoxin forming N-methyltransferase GntF n=1 Tax=Actinoplanes sp. NBC_00393 TaxID=2975953 RepID=UPI002E23011A